MSERPGRLESLDIFRGATVASMLLVNNPGSWNAVWWPLGHAEWHGWTPTDLIFPFFLFIVGVTTELSRKEPLRILRRGFLIVLCGLLLNAFPFYWWGRMGTITDPTLWDRIVWRFDHLRWAGVLQRIGVVYAISALLAWWLPKKALAGLAVVILLGYWAALSTHPLEPPGATLAAMTDRAILGERHIWSSSRIWDPEGPLSTIPAVATALAGVLAAGWVRDRKVTMLTIAGAAGAAAGLAWGAVFPINKNLWTSSYVVFTAGAAMLLLALTMWAVDVRGWRRWGRPLTAFGLNPLVAFLGSGMMARLLILVKVDGVSLQAWTFRRFFEPFFPPHLASFLWALTFVLFWLAILGVMMRRRWIVKI